MVKKEYKNGDTVWIHGIGTKNKLTQGTVISCLDLSSKGYSDSQYIIEIPTHIEPLLEVRSWYTISQDENGPVGGLRSMMNNLSRESKKISQLGIVMLDTNENDDDPTPDEIIAALEQSTTGLTHKPLQLKEPKPKRRYYPRKKK